MCRVVTATLMYIRVSELRIDSCPLVMLFTTKLLLALSSSLLTMMCFIITWRQCRVARVKSKEGSSSEACVARFNVFDIPDFLETLLVRYLLLSKQSAHICASTNIGSNTAESNGNQMTNLLLQAPISSSPKTCLAWRQIQ